MTTLMVVFAYGFLIVTGVVLVVYGLSQKPQKECYSEEPRDFFTPFEPAESPTRDLIELDIQGTKRSALGEAGGVAEESSQAFSGEACNPSPGLIERVRTHLRGESNPLMKLENDIDPVVEESVVPRSEEIRASDENPVEKGLEQQLAVTSQLKNEGPIAVTVIVPSDAKPEDSKAEEEDMTALDWWVRDQVVETDSPVKAKEVADTQADALSDTKDSK
jgi:hypothetical protein